MAQEPIWLFGSFTFNLALCMVKIWFMRKIYKWSTLNHYTNPNWILIVHVNSIPTRQIFTGISSNTQSKLCVVSMTERVWDFRNNALWDTHYHIDIINMPYWGLDWHGSIFFRQLPQSPPHFHSFQRCSQFKLTLIFEYILLECFSSTIE